MTQSLLAQSFEYQKPPASILELADITLAPIVMADKTSQNLVMLQRSAYKTLEELAEDELRLGGIRVNPANFNTARTSYYTGVEILNVETGKKIPILGLPSKLRIEYIGLSPKNTYFSFVNVLPDGMELWLLELKTGKASRLTMSNLSAVMGSPYFWSSDEKHVYCRWLDNKSQFPTTKELPTGPAIQEATGTKAAARTFQDLLKNPSDEKKFDFYASSSIVKFEIKTKKMSKLLGKGIYKGIQVSPDGTHLLITEVLRPYSYQLPYSRFPYKSSVYDNNGKLVQMIVEKPLQENIPQGFSACEAGRRNIAWRADKASTLYYVEAQDGGDPAKEVSVRDQVFLLAAPFKEGKLMASTQNRFNDITWGNDSVAILYDYWWKTRNTKTYLINPSTNNLAVKILYDLSTEDMYKDPGNFVTEYNEYGRLVLKFSKDKSLVYLQGEGYSPEGNKPFVRSFSLADNSEKTLWQADGKTTYERIVNIIDMEAGKLLTRIENQKMYPNFHIRSFDVNTPPKQITSIENPYKALDKVTKQKIYYKRNDGVELHANLYLPAGYDKAKDGKLPILMSAYPTEFKDSKNASQVKESPYQFVTISWGSPVFWVTRGFAVLEDAQFPIIGQGKTESNDTYVPQLVANAQAALDALDSLGVGDVKRAAVMGHSYGAFMTINLLAHSNLFAAGIARSGAYNRTLTPFGFQSEERNYWEATKIYQEMSPFNYADKIKSPALFIHGDADNNPGTFTLQSERMFQAIKGLGGVARLVLLPYESHGYAAKDNILHVLWETDTWLEKYVKNKQ